MNYEDFARHYDQAMLAAMVEYGPGHGTPINDEGMCPAVTGLVLYNPNMCGDSCHGVGRGRSE